MTFLEAHRTLRAFQGGPSLAFLLAMSGTSDPLELYVRAAAARQGRLAQIRTLPFGTLAQALRRPVEGTDAEVVLLLPWDLVPHLDWRVGLPQIRLDLSAAEVEAAEVCDLIRARSRARVVYLPAKLPPAFVNAKHTRKLEALLLAKALSLEAQVLPESAFSLGAYLATGCPVAGAELARTAEVIVGRALDSGAQTKKVLVTDLDNVLWGGVVAEVGAEGVSCSSEGAGYRHFLFQTLLAKLRREGTLLAAVSRNDEQSAMSPFKAGVLSLPQDDFVAILASYGAKSALILELSKRLNLGLDSFVFIDDNELELAEVSASLPEVTTLRFPASDEGLPDFFTRIGALFSREAVTSEDEERTALYRRRLAGMRPSHLSGADLTSFLRGLEMRLTVYDRRGGARQRAIQLINKTTQFNLNGKSVRDSDVEDVLGGGGSLLTAELSDRTGSHGEIIALLVTVDGTVRSFVMSCRVFERRVEYAFLCWVAKHHPLKRFAFAETPRNEPMRRFLEDSAFGRAPPASFDADAFVLRHAADADLFEIVSVDTNV